MHRIEYNRRNRREKNIWLCGLIFFLLLGACQSVPIMNETGNSVGEITVTEVPPGQTSAPEETVTPAPEPTMVPTLTMMPEPTKIPTLIGTPTPTMTPVPVSAAVEKTSLFGFLQIAMQPVGKTMYVWGGGWNEEDTGAGVEAVTLGVSPAWAEFAAKQDGTYDFRETRYQIHDGLDCSGYVGWAVYNVLESESGKEGYVLSSTKMAEDFASRGLGDYIPAKEMTHWQAGDIMSMKGHVWIAVGMCEDGSVLLLHASPPGVSFCGTELADGSKSKAVLLAEQVMQTYYPEWYVKFPECARPHSYLINSSAMRWNREVLDDEEGLAGLSAEEVISVLYGQQSQ